MELKNKITNDELLGIKTPEIIAIMRTIKAIQKRMKDPDLVNAPYIRVYEQLSNEFTDFCDQNTATFIKVIRGDNLNTVTAVLFYKDKVIRGLIPEKKLMKMLAKKYIPEELQDEAFARMKEMKLTSQESR